MIFSFKRRRAIISNSKNILVDVVEILGSIVMEVGGFLDEEEHIQLVEELNEALEYHKNMAKKSNKALEYNKWNMVEEVIIKGVSVIESGYKIKKRRLFYKNTCIITRLTAAVK
jgi:hypothetical protein